MPKAKGVEAEEQAAPLGQGVGHRPGHRLPLGVQRDQLRLSALHRHV